MTGKFLRRGAIVDTIKSEHRTNAIQKRDGLTMHPVTARPVVAPIRTVDAGTRYKRSVPFPRQRKPTLIWPLRTGLAKHPKSTLRTKSVKIRRKAPNNNAAQCFEMDLFDRSYPMLNAERVCYSVLRKPLTRMLGVDRNKARAECDKDAMNQAMHLSREMRRFEVEDLSSRRGDRRRYLAKADCDFTHQ